jgi:tRNA (mo5U34)-methyltransferase
MSLAPLADRATSVEEIRWWHQVPLRDGRITPGEIPVYRLEHRYLFDTLDFEGKSVLDIGCWDGYFSFMAERRGATRVVALDDPDFRWGGLAGFNFLHDHFQSGVEWARGTVYRLPDEMFDIVLCYGVLYHLSDPLLAAINCFQRSRSLVLFEGLMFLEAAPLLKLLEPGCYLNADGSRDHSNFYTMSTGYLEMIGRLNGFELAEYQPTDEVRGVMCFRATGKTAPGFVPASFPVPPSIPV